MNVPQLRFNGFEGEWEKKKVKEIAPLQRGFDLVKEAIIPGKYPIGYSNGILGFHNEFKAKGPGVFTGRSGTIGNIHFTESDYWPHNTSLWVTDFKGNNEKFIYYFYKKLDLKKYNAGSTVPTLNRNDVHDLTSFLPKRKEQDKIATFLTLLDKKIKKQQEKIEKLEQFKKGIMQKIFSQELRFKDEDGGEFGEWEIVKMREVTRKVGPRNKDDQKLPIYSINNKKGFLLQNEQFESSRLEDLEKVSYKIVKPNEFAYNPSRINVGSIGHLKTDFPVLISSLYVCFETKSDVDPLFMEQYLSTYNFSKEVSKNTEGSVREYLFYENFSNIKFPKPTFTEQQKIAKYLNAFSIKLQKEQEKLKVFEEQKKGFMQGMFV